MQFRLATNNDLPAIMDIVHQAQTALKNSDIDQWQNGYPSEAIFRQDIAGNHAFVVTEKDNVIAMISIFFNDEPTYDTIYEGQWLTNGEFMVAHRMAVDNCFKNSGVAAFIFTQIEAMSIQKGITSFKADTHNDNIPMRRFLEKHSFTYCGIIYLRDGNKRLAYEKILS